MRSIVVRRNPLAFGVLVILFCLGAMLLTTAIYSVRSWYAGTMPPWLPEGRALGWMGLEAMKALSSGCLGVVLAWPLQKLTGALGFAGNALGRHAAADGPAGRLTLHPPRPRVRGWPSRPARRPDVVRPFSRIVLRGWRRSRGCARRGDSPRRFVGGHIHGGASHASRTGLGIDFCVRHSDGAHGGCLARVRHRSA
jgi:hypothetical protein